MEAQTPAEGISEFPRHKGWRWYRIPCSCGCDEQVDISVEVDDPTDGIITAHISANVKTPYWRRTFDITYQEPWLVYALKDWANGIINRFKICWTALAHGYVEMESYTLLTEQQAMNLSATLAQAVSEVREESEKIRIERQNRNTK